MTGHVFLRWKVVVLHLSAGQFLAAVSLQRSTHNQEHYRQFFFFPSSGKVCFLPVEVTGGTVTKGLIEASCPSIHVYLQRASGPVV